MGDVAAENWWPDLSKVFFAESVGDSHEDHANDSCCVSLNREWLGDDAARWFEVLEQHVAAFIALAGDAAARAGNEERNWYMGRPLLFSAHHVAELALKSVTLSAAAEWPGPNGRSGHVLSHLMSVERGVNQSRGSAEWEDAFVAMLDQAQEGGRYPTDRRSGPLLDQWCCVSASALGDAVTAFLYLVIPGYRGQADEE